jgi:hypothetical protein
MSDTPAEPERKPAQPMSLKLPPDLRAELLEVSRSLGETEATVARMSMRHGLRVLMASLQPDQTAA